MVQSNLVTDAQTQLGYKICEPQLATKRKDLKQMQALRPFLKQLQQNSAKLVKDYHQYLSTKGRKLSGLPYHMIKKFQSLQNNLHETRKLLLTQCRQFQLEVAGRDFDKDNQQHFFKKTMKSYDQRRLWLKNYILKNESRMQVVEQEVKKNIDYETHKFTQYIYEIDLQRLQHNYIPKIQAQQQVLLKVEANANLRDKIKLCLAKQYKRLNKAQATNAEAGEKQDKSHPAELQINIKSIWPFLTLYSIKINIHNAFLLSQLKRVRSQKALLSHHNQQLKIAIDMTSQSIEDSRLQSKIIQGNFRNQHQLLQDKLLPSAIITKTDYFIYLREMHRQIQQKLKLFGRQFRYMLFLPQNCYYQRTISAKKRYTRAKQAQSMLKIQANKSKAYLRDYAQRERSIITAQKEQRLRMQRERLQQERQQLQKINQELKKEFEDNKLIEQQQPKPLQVDKQQQILYLLQNAQKQEGGQKAAS